MTQPDLSSLALPESPRNAPQEIPVNQKNSSSTKVHSIRDNQEKSTASSRATDDRPTICLCWEGPVGDCPKHRHLAASPSASDRLNAIADFLTAHGRDDGGFDEETERRFYADADFLRSLARKL